MTRVLTNLSLSEAVDAAVARLVSVRHADGISHVHLPIFYPSGAAVAVSVEQIADGYLVTDEGFAFREVEMVGAEDSFTQTATSVVGTAGLGTQSRQVTAVADVDSLTSAIADVAAASARITYDIVDLLEAADTAEP